MSSGPTDKHPAPAKLYSFQGISMRECFIDRLILRVNFGVNRAYSALVIFCNKFNLTGNELTIPAHRIPSGYPCW